MINKTILKIIIIIALLVGMNFYVNEYNIDDAKQIDSINVNKNDFIKIKQAMKCEDIYIEIILEHLLKAGINEVYEAYIVEDDTSAIALEIKSANEKVYRVYCNSSYLFKAIRDMETGKLIYSVIQ